MSEPVSWLLHVEALKVDKFEQCLRLKYDQEMRLGVLFFGGSLWMQPRPADVVESKL